MKVGVVTRSFPEMDNAAAARFMAETGFETAELCLSQTDSKYWAYNGLSDISGLTDARMSEIVETYRRENIEVSVLGVFTNLIETDSEKLAANLSYFERHMQYAVHCGIPVLATECGFDPQSRGVRADVYESRYSLLLDSLKRLCEMADRYGVDIALEPCVLDVVPSAKRMADTIRQVGSRRLKVLLDPANLIANSSERDMFEYLSPHIAYFHGKDRRINDTYGRNVGDGDIDWPLFLSLYHSRNEGAPFILEYCNASNCAEILRRVKEYDRQSELLHTSAR